MQQAKSGIRRLVVLGLALILVGCSATATSTPTPRTDFHVGLLFNAGGTISDGTFNGLAYSGTARAIKDLGLPDVVYKIPAEDKDYPDILDKMVADGQNIIVTVGFETQDATLAAAAKYPQVHFIGIDEIADTMPSNFISVLFKEDQGGFLAGALAGLMTKSNVIGVIGGIKIPAIVRFVDGFRNGVSYVNPNANALYVYTSGFANVDEGRSTAEDMIKQKADVIFGAAGLTGSSGIVRAAALKVWVIGVDQDEFRTTFATGKDADYILTSVVKRTDVAVYNEIVAVVNNKITTNKVVVGTADCGIMLAPFHKADAVIPADVKTKLQAIWRALAGNTLSTGASSDLATQAPAPLASNAMPPISDSAPKLDSCPTL
jgi:basic membrane lipoprotein Med (substrate-binding protein (PBP1-ABC) superfamily)